MIAFKMLRPGEMAGWPMKSVTVLELDFWDLLKLLLGRELKSGAVVLRSGHAYSAFNLGARPTLD